MVIMSAIALVLIFAAALLFLWFSGRYVIPTSHPRPLTSYLSAPAGDLAPPNVVTAQPA